MYVLITLDLKNKVTNDNRQIFYDYLEEQNWYKYDDVDTAWYCSFNSPCNVDEIYNIIKQDLNNASKKAKRTSYNVVLAVSKYEPIEF